MDDAFFVSGLQTFAALGGDGEKFVGGNGLFEAVAESFAFDKLHDQPEFAGVLDHVVHGSDIGVVEGGGALGFLEQALAVGGIGMRAGGHALDGDKALERGVFRAVDLSHAACAEALGNDEAADGGAGEGIRRSVSGSSRRGRLDLFCHGRSGRRILQF